jgi:tetratricopeptide (TPR) repeat protein
MRIGFLVWYVSSAFGARYAVAQDVPRHAVLSAACIEFNQTAINQVAGGRLEDAESALSAALADRANGSEQSCAGLTLYNSAVVMALAGRFAEAEVLAERSLKILEKSYPPDDPVLLRPLQMLSSIQFEQGKIAKARGALQRMHSIRTERPADHAMVHGLAATLLHAEGRYSEAEAEYLKALGAWEESGRGETTDVAAVLDGLATLYIAAGRYREASLTLDRALAIVTSAKDAVPTDRINLFIARAKLQARQGEWREAEADLRSAISTAEHDTRLDPVVLKFLLTNYAHVLRKNHRGREARTIEARAAALQTHGLTDAVVDASELFAKPRTAKR